MKKLRLKVEHFSNAEVLSREQLKKVLGGMSIDGSGSCQNECDECNTQKALNCCSGLRCAENLCRVATE